MSEQNPKPKSRDAARPTRRAKATSATKPKAAAKTKPAARPKPKTAAKAPAARRGAPSRDDAPARPSALDGVRGKLGAAGEAVRDPRALVAGHRVAVVAVAAALVLFVALYGPACGLYQAWRENGVLLAEQERASAESEELEGDISTLMTEDGIKDEARRRGYVEEGETRIVVEGAESEDDASADENETEETPWYLSVGDFLFQYHPSEEGEK